MKDHYEKIRRGETDLLLISGSLPDRLSGLDILFSLEPGLSVLDIGCHEGMILAELARRGAAIVHGIDLHDPSLTIAKQRLRKYPSVIKKFDLCEGIGQLRKELPLLPQYDVILFLGIYHHMVRQMPAERVSEFVSQLFPMANRYLAIRTPARFMDVLKKEPIMDHFRLVHRQEASNPDVSPVEIYSPKTAR